MLQNEMDSFINGGFDVALFGVGSAGAFFYNSYTILPLKYR